MNTVNKMAVITYRSDICTSVREHCRKGTLNVKILTSLIERAGYNSSRQEGVDLER